MKHALIVFLVSASTLLALLCALGVAVMKDAYQRLHFSAPIVDLCAPMLTLAVWLSTTDWQARIKSILVTLLLFFMNAVLTHATARAHRVRQVGHVELRREDRGVERIS